MINDKLHSTKFVACRNVSRTYYYNYMRLELLRCSLTAVNPLTIDVKESHRLLEREVVFTAY